MHGLFRRVITTLRAGQARLVTTRAHVPTAEKLLRGMLLVPLYCAMWLLLMARLKLAGPLVVEAVTRFGSRFECRLPDFIQTYLYIFGTWEPDISAFVRRRLSSGDTFIDVGANVGYYVLLASRQLDGDGRIVAVESSPAIFRMLEQSLHDNDRPAGVRTVNMAAGAEVGSLKIYRGPPQNIGLSTTVVSRGLVHEGEIPAAPLADLLEPHEIGTARLVKIDVEGAEPDVLRGLATFLERCPKNVEIAIELSPAWWSDRTLTVRQVLEPLVAMGFNVYRVDNPLGPWRYLWPCEVQPPRRVRGPLTTRRIKRFDLILSRVDAEVL